MTTPLSTRLVTPNSGLLYGTPGGATTPIQVRNMDSVKVVWVANVSNVATDGSNGIPLDPGDSVTFDGSTSIYAVSPSGPAVVALVPGGVSFAPGSIDITGPVTATISGPVTIAGTPDVTIAGQLASLDVSAAVVDVIGQGGFVLPGQLALLLKNALTVNVAALGSTIVGTFTVSNYSSIVINSNSPANSSTAAGAAVCVQWQFVWMDNAGNILATESFSCFMGSVVSVQMPVRGSQVQITLLNNGSSGTISYLANAIKIEGDYRQINKPVVMFYGSSASPVVSGFNVLPVTQPVSTIAAWIAALQSNAFAILANTSYLVPMPLWYGNVSGWYQQVTQALAQDATIIDVTFGTQGSIVTGTGYANGIMQNLPSAIQGSPVNITYNSPLSQLAFTFKTGAAVGDTFLMLTGAS